MEAWLGSKIEINESLFFPLISSLDNILLDYAMLKIIENHSSLNIVSRKNGVLTL